MTKADVVQRIHEKLDIPRGQVLKLAELVFDVIKETLRKEDKIVISGFGNFLVRSKRSRRGRNPQAGGEIEITARRVLTFRPSPVFTANLNKPKETTLSPLGKCS